MIKVTSFGFKHGRPKDADVIFDCRDLPNPHHVPVLKSLTGKDERVKAFVVGHPESGKLLDAAVDAVQDGNTKIYFGCIGGRHRSVALAEAAGAILERKGFEVEVAHRELA